MESRSPAPQQIASTSHGAPRSPHKRAQDAAKLTTLVYSNSSLSKDNSPKVVVTGFPSQTQPQDLGRAFSQFGNVRIDLIKPKVALLSFATENEADEAVKASKKVEVHSSFLNVKKYTGGELNPEKIKKEKKRPPPKREFPKSKQKGTIISPSQLDWSGDFYDQVDRLMAAIRLSKDEVEALQSLINDLQSAMQIQWPDCKTLAFGSITTGLGTKTSDADCFVYLPPEHRTNPNDTFVNKAKRLLQQFPDTFDEVFSIPRANTPIVKFFHIPTATNCDVSFKTLLGVQNSKLIAFLLHADPRLIHLAVIIKYWARVNEFSGTGKLTNYALILLLIFYCQQPPMCILPSVEWLQRDPTNDVIVDFWNTGFMSDMHLLPPCSNTSSLAELLGGFFEFYSTFNFEELTVCPYLGTAIRKDTFRDLDQLPVQCERYKKNVTYENTYPLRFTTSMVVQDPIEHCHNVASAITPRLAVEIKAYFKFAADAYEKYKLSGCKDFLKTILLQKPKLPKAKSAAEFRVTLFPRIVTTIKVEDWKGVIRKTVSTIFENILKMKVEKSETKTNPESKKQKEKYSVTTTKAVWKRKQFNRIYGLMKLGFQEKETRITEEVMNVEKQTIKLQFHLTLTYCQEPRSVVLTTKIIEGDVEAFKDFGRFFMSAMQQWFVILIRPHCSESKKSPEMNVSVDVQQAETSEKNGNSTIDTSFESENEDHDETREESSDNQHNSDVEVEKEVEHHLYNDSIAAESAVDDKLIDK